MKNATCCALALSMLLGAASCNQASEPGTAADTASTPADTASTPADTVDPDASLAAGCCLTAADCPVPEGKTTRVCVDASPNAAGRCEILQFPHSCFADTDCPPDKTCHGAATCPCDAKCADVQAGICIPKAPGCAPIQQSWIEESCDAAHLVVWNGQSCQETCPGCCGCGSFCDLTFPDMATCLAGCASESRESYS